MPSPLAHSAAGLALYYAMRRSSSESFGWKGAAAFVALASLPDLDYVPGILAGEINRFHHGNWIAHSFGFGLALWAAIFAAGRAAGWRAARRWCVWGFALYASHLALDFFSMDLHPPIGQMLFWPFSAEHFISPVPLFASLSKSTYAEVLQWSNAIAVLREAAVLSPLALAAAIDFASRRDSSELTSQSEEGI